MQTYVDRVRETTTGTGTGNLTLAGAVTGFITFDTAFGHAGSVSLFEYVISSDGGSEWEVGLGHLSASTTLVRDSIIASSTGSAVNFSAGTKDVRGTISGPTLTGYRAELAAEGLVSETYSRKARGLAGAPTNGVIYYCMAPFFKGDVVTNISVVITTASSAATLAKLGLYDKTGTRLGLTATAHASFNAAAGLYTVALTAPFTITATDGYYLAFITVGGTAPNVLGQAVALTAGANAAVGSAKSPLGIQTGQTDLVSPGTVTSGSATAASFWLGAS